MDGRPTWTDCDEAEDYVVPNVLSPRDLVYRPDSMDETVPHMYNKTCNCVGLFHFQKIYFASEQQYIKCCFLSYAMEVIG